ncbi:MAG TPA: hypothetical protein VFE47_14195 [Tepidisphaeraceae bacterium]|jgi:hypothetical protein|nr:hypothetical protein [Tepidisphaeraceae bacterium]
MPITITLDDKLAAGLECSAKRQHLTVEQFALNVLSEAAEDPDELSLEELVKKIQAMPPNPASIRHATGDLAAALRAIPEDPNFDEEAWNRDWAAIEAEMKAVTRANDIAEGRE